MDTYIQISEMSWYWRRKPRLARARPKLVCCEAWWLRSNYHLISSSRSWYNCKSIVDLPGVDMLRFKWNISQFPLCILIFTLLCQLGPRCLLKKTQHKLIIIINNNFIDLYCANINPEISNLRFPTLLVTLLIFNCPNILLHIDR